MDNTNINDQQFRQISPANRHIQGPGDLINAQGDPQQVSAATRNIIKNSNSSNRPQKQANSYGYNVNGKQGQQIKQTQMITAKQPPITVTKSMERVGHNKDSDVQSALQMQALGMGTDPDDEQLHPSRFNNTLKIQSTKNHGAKKIRLGNSVKGGVSGKKKSTTNEQYGHQQPFVAQPNHSFLDMGEMDENGVGSLGRTGRPFPQSEQISYEQDSSPQGHTEYSLQKTRGAGQATSSNMILDSELQTMSVARGMMSGKPQQGPSQQVKSKSKAAGAGATRRKPSITGSKKQIVLVEPMHLAQGYLQDLNAQNELLGGVRGSSNYTTTNAKNQRIGSISGDPHTLTFALQANGNNAPHATGVGTTMNSQAMHAPISLYSNIQQKPAGNKLNEFNCLINANQNQPALLQQKQINLHPKGTENHKKIPGRGNSGQPSLKPGKSTQKAQIKNGGNLHELQIQKQTSNESDPSMLQNVKLNQKPHSIKKQIVTNSFNNTQHFTAGLAGGLGLDYKEVKSNQSRGQTKIMQGAGGSKKGSQNNKRQLVQQQNFQFLQNRQDMVKQSNNGPVPFGLLNMGQYMEQNQIDASIGQQSHFGNHMFAQVHGSSSATNKVKKAFDFDLDPKGKLKRDRHVGLSTQGQNSGNGGTKGVGAVNQINNGKKVGSQKSTKLKTQMNQTGPLPKHLLSPTNITNQSQGKSKHSQYFDNTSEIVTAQAQLYQQQLNSSQQFHQMQHETEQTGYKDRKPPLQAQYQVQLNSLNPGQVVVPDAGIQGCNTVININIDSNTWNRQSLRDSNNFQEQQNHKQIGSRNNADDNTGTHPSLQDDARQPRVQYMTNSQHAAPLPPSSQGPAYQTVKRQSSSKMRRNDSISSNKSKRNNVNSNNNRRSSSSSHVQQQQIHQLQQINSLNYNQQQYINQVQKAPHSNADIILNNIAKINEKLQQQEMGNGFHNLNSTQQQLLININDLNDLSSQQSNLNKTTKVSLIKSKSLNKEPAQKKGSGGQSHVLKNKEFKSKPVQMLSLNQTQKLALISNATSITVNDSMQQQMFSIIPKKRLLDGNTPVNRKQSHKQLKIAPYSNTKHATNNPKLTLKKVVGQKGQGQNSQIGSARTKKQSSQNQQQRYYVQEQIQILQQSHDEGINSNQQRQIEDYDQHLLDMENQIQQNQIRLRNELAQIQNVKAGHQNGKSLEANQDQMEEMGMDVDMEDIMIENHNALDDNFQNSTSANHSGLTQYQQQMQVMQQNLFRGQQSYATNGPAQNRYQTQQMQSFSRQQSQEDQNIESTEAQSMQQSSQLRASNQKRGQSNKQPVNQNQGNFANLQGNRNTGTSSQRRPKGKANRLSNSKVNIEDIQIDIDGIMRNQLLMDSTLGLAAAVHNFGTKKSVTTKNQNVVNKMQTQNVQSLLREAKREMLIDPNELDQIQVGGDDLTVKHTQKKSFNFNGTQNLALGSSNFGTQQQRLHMQYGVSPTNKKEDMQSNGTIISGNLSSQPYQSNYKTNQTVVENFNTPAPAAQNQGTFGLGQINMKKQITKPNMPQQNNQASQQVQSQFINQMQQQRQFEKLIKQGQNTGGQNQQLQSQQVQMMQLQQAQQQKYIQMQQVQKVKSKQHQASENSSGMGPQAPGANKISGQSQSNTNSLGSSKQKMPQFQQKGIQSQQVQKPGQRDPQHSQSGTFNSQMSETDIAKNQRNSNMPPNSASNMKIEVTDEDLLANSRVSGIDESDAPVLADVPRENHAHLLPSESVGKNQQVSQQEPQADDQALELRLPLSGAKVLKHYLKRAGLTEYEKSEILDYRQCYYLGIGAQKIKGSRQQQYNFGYDDERGDYSVVLQDHIAYRFEVLDFLGKGSFGQALKCIDHKTKEIVALKVIRNKKKFQHQAGVELKILLHLKENDPDDTNNIIRIKDYCMFRKHLVISFELFSINLYEFIKNNNFEGVSLSLIRRFAIQILQALKYLREESLIHCDLKPENILLKSPDKSGIKVIDFGSSCFSNERIYTYIQSRFYRAPEIIMGIPYTAAIDMWSFGCILTELFTGVPIFPGESEQEQLSLIMEVIGLPKEEILSQATRKRVFFDEKTNEPYLSQDSQGNLRIPSSKPLDEILMCQSDSFQDFIKCCLEWDPEKRITPFDALMHDWIIEGLPPQVLIHHKKMLGIYESDTEEEHMVTNERTQSALDESPVEYQNQSQSQGYDIDQFDQFDQQIDQTDLSSSQIQIVNDQSINDTGDYQQLEACLDQKSQQDLQNQLQIDKIISNNLEDNNKHGKQSINFYGQNVKSTEHQEYSSRYESILSHGANKNLMRNQKKLNDKDGVHGNQFEPKEFNRDGAKKNHIQAAQSDMQEDEQWDEIENHPDINRAMGQGMRGIPQINDHDVDNIAQNSLIPRKHKNQQLAGMVLNDASQKSKTTNMTEILSQVNKKSKSTKNQRAQGIQYAFAPPTGDANLAAGSHAINIVQQCAKQKAQRGMTQEQQNNNPNELKRNSFFQEVYQKDLIPNNKFGVTQQF